VLLASDFHLDDKPENAYRWRVFDSLAANSDGEILILGDLADRADRHSAVLVNYLISCLTDLTEQGHRLHILCGNHDLPVKGEPYWTFLNKLPKISFYSQPTAVGNRLFLPYSHNPRAEWEGIPFDLYTGIFMHQTVDGADAGHGMTLSNPNMIELSGIKGRIYSGDIHIPQVVGKVVYVGAPCPIKFGDGYRCRMLLIDDEDYRLMRDITLRRIKKRVIELADSRQLDGISLGAGDQARIKFVLPADRVSDWPVEQATIAAWAKEKGVHLASVELILEGQPVQDVGQYSFDSDPEHVLRGYCAAEGISGELLQSGLAFLQNLKG
jgi:Calcineurin-like phosphoesterase